MIKSILVVCVGNICRSPVGERSLKSRLPDMKLQSAGIGALVGHPADEVAAGIAAQGGVSLVGHVAQQFTVEMANAHDLILVMETGHRNEIVRKAPHLSGKIMLFDHWSGGAGIADPFRKAPGFHQEVFEQIIRAAEAWAERLNGNAQ
ncbi:arsenate reductase/protein-tyrosine-phosphatase family protein [Pontibaca salina]|uniref:protein-tyrosine-phosphatase n=1 Tax=Pontibaca salina TaxID=2795731 RepID=A0A934HM57_9RHOB|nr:low molecular weight phosphotyrosine protein phosphatase [Pontibaca salina]MBI6630769.1 low molecular weight phosphotyrosine protein phosphatase [Pontibaca salina]